MKNLVYIIFVTLFLSSCFTDSSKVSELKDDLLIQESENVELVEEDIWTEPVVPEQDLDQKVQVIALSEKQFLSFNDIPESSLGSGEIEISWSALPGVTSIEVTFTNPTSDYPDDIYTLQTFESGDSEFIYRASSRNQVLDYGENQYIFKASSGGVESLTKVVILVPTKQEEQQWEVEKDIIGFEDNTLLVDFPTSSKYGEPIKLWEASFTYSGIKGLEVEKEVLRAVSCEEITDYLSERINTWYYWNTCRDIVKDEGIKYNVLRLDWDEYIYERHYLDFKHGFYGIYELEKGTWVDPDNIKEKNDELKVQDFPSLEVVDDLMKDIVNS